MDKYGFINFSLNLTKMPWQSWSKLGKCASKCQQISRIPLKPAIRDELHLVYLAKGALATTAIEGNTLTEQQVLELLDNKLKLPSSKEYLEQELKNIIEACNNIMIEIAKAGTLKINIEKLCEYNKAVIANNVPREEASVPGKIRDHNVVVGNIYRPPDAKDVKKLLREFCNWMNSEDFKSDQMSVHFAIIKAVIAHLYIAWIHPFGDGNGRVARLVEFAILLGSSVPSPVAHLLSNHYNLTRSMYYKQLDKAGKTNNPVGFIEYAIDGLLDGLNEQIKFVEKHIIGICWRDYIFEKFDKLGSGKVIKRQRNLALLISSRDEPVTQEQIKLLMTEQYKNTARTLQRDLNRLEKLDLVKRDKNKYFANKAFILQYLPFSI